MEKEKLNQKSKKKWYKTWWGILLLLIFWPFSLSFFLWRRKWNLWVRIGLVSFFWIFLLLFLVGLSSEKGQKSFQEGHQAGKETAMKSQSSPSPSSIQTAKNAPTPSPKPSQRPEPILESAPKLTPTPTSERKIVKGNTPKGLELYEKVEDLHKQGVVKGELYIEFESDAVVDVNPEAQAVQLGLKYSSISNKVDGADKALILNDFKVIKELAEQDDSLILPDLQTLGLFVLTFHDNSGVSRGEIQQTMMDEEPSWDFWE